MSMFKAILCLLIIPIYINFWQFLYIGNSLNLIYIFYRLLYFGISYILYISFSLFIYILIFGNSYISEILTTLYIFFIGCYILPFPIYYIFLFGCVIRVVVLLVVLLEVFSLSFLY